MQTLFLSSASVFAVADGRAATADHIKAHAQEIRGLEVPQSLLDSFDGKKLILLGESHGTNETPDYVAAIVKAVASGRPVAVGLEFPSDIQGAVDDYLSSGNEDILKDNYFFQDAVYNSGRGSRAMVRLLGSLRPPSAVKAFCFDVPRSARVPNRDTAMAENILRFLKEHPEETLIALTGNIHSRLTVGFPADPNYKTMGSEILRLAQGSLSPDAATSVLFRYDEGSAWQCRSGPSGKADCGEKQFPHSGGAYAAAVGFDRYYLREPEITDGHRASLFLRRVSASMPMD